MTGQVKKLKELLSVRKFGCGQGSMIAFDDDGSGDAHFIFPFDCFEIDFCFIKKGAAPGLRNLLDCRVRQEGDRRLCFPLSRALLELHPDRYICTFYPFVASEEQLERALEELCGVVSENLPGLCALFRIPEKRRMLFEEAAREVNAFADDEVLVEENGVFVPNRAHEENYVYNAVKFSYRSKMIRRITMPYAAVFTGIGEPDLRWISYRGGSDAEFCAMSALSADNVSTTPLQKELFAAPKRYNGLRAIPAALLCVAAYSVPTALVSALLYLLFSGVFSKLTLLTTSVAPERMAPIAVAAVLGAICFTAFDTRIIYRVVYGKRLYRDYADMLGGEKRFLRVLSSFALALIAVYIILSGARTLRFEEERFADGREFTSLSETYYLYSQVERAGIIEGATSSNGTALSEAKLALLLRDGKIIDFGGYASEEYAEKKILPLLEKKGIPFGGRYATAADFAHATGEEQ